MVISKVYLDMRHNFWETLHKEYYINRMQVLWPSILYLHTDHLWRRPIWWCGAPQRTLSTESTRGSTPRPSTGTHEWAPWEWFSELRDVHTVSRDSRSRADAQHAYFLGATLKYLYLTFTPDTFLPLDQWMFNWAGQPLPVCGKSAAYPKCTS